MVKLASIFAGGVIPFFLTVSALAGPDLSTRARLDADNRLIVDVANRGDSPVSAGIGSVSIFIDGRAVGSYAFENLSDQSFRSPGGLISIPTNFRLGGRLRRISVVVDRQDQIAENREDHNSYSVTLNPPAIPGPDLIVSRIGLEGGNLVFNIRNIGNRPVPSGLTARVRIIIDERVAADLRQSFGGLLPGGGAVLRPSPSIPITGRKRVRVLLNMNGWSDETDNTNNVREETIPSPSIFIYWAWLWNPTISQAIRWNGVPYPDWTAPQKDDLSEALRKVENGDNPGLSAPPRLNTAGHVTAGDAWRIYVHHVAHALWIDRSNKVPWRLIDMRPSDLRLLLDGENLITQVSDGTYLYSSSAQGNLTVWNPRISYEFMTNLGLVKSNQRDTIFAFTDWARAHLRHISGSHDTSVVYGYDGPPPADRILYPVEGQQQLSPGCWGMTPLWIAVLRGVNIPAEFGTVLYSGGLHARPIFPTIGMGLSHGDDPYNGLYLSTGRPVPIGNIFQSLSDIQTLYLSPTPECPGGSCVSQAEQASFNAAKFSLDVVIASLGDRLLSGYRLGGATGLRDTLIGPTRGGSHYLHRSLTTPAEQNAVISRVETELRSLGGGSITVGEAVVAARIAEHSFHRLRRPLVP